MATQGQRRKCKFCEGVFSVNQKTEATRRHKISPEKHAEIHGPLPYLDGVCAGSGYVPR